MDFIQFHVICQILAKFLGLNPKGRYLSLQKGKENFYVVFFYVLFYFYVVQKRGIIITESLIDVLLTNRPDSFHLSGNYHPCLSDHDLVYGVLKQKINHNKPKVITFRSYKNFDPEHYKQLLSSAPWHVGQYYCLMTSTIKFTCGMHL